MEKTLRDPGSAGRSAFGSGPRSEDAIKAGLLGIASGVSGYGREMGASSDRRRDLGFEEFLKENDPMIEARRLLGPPCSLAKLGGCRTERLLGRNCSAL